MTKFAPLVFSLALHTGLSASLLAGGFQIQEQGAPALALAGALTARPAQLTASFYNPAGLVGLSQSQVQLGGSVLVPSVQFSGINPYPGYGVASAQVRRVLTPASLFAAWSSHPRFTLGLALTVPYARRHEWRDPFHFSGRYIAMKSELWHLRATLAAGYRLTSRLALGIGLFVGKSFFSLDSVYPLVLAGRIFDAAHLNLSGASRLAAGWQAGVQFQANRRLTLGLAYTSKLRQAFRQQDVTFTQIHRGEVKFDQALNAVLPARQRFDSDWTLPATFAFGIHYRLSERANLAADLSWTHWQSFREQQFILSDSVLSFTRPANWRNVLSLRAGLDYALSPMLRYRLGYAFDPSPQPNETVSPQWVDADRHLFSMGLGTRIAGLDIDTAVQFSFYQIRKIRDANVYAFYGDYALFQFRTGVSVIYRF